MESVISQLLNKLVAAAHSVGATDIHLRADRVPRVRIDGALQDLGDVATGALAPDALDALAHQISGDAYGKLEETGEVKIASPYTDERSKYKSKSYIILYILVVALVALAIFWAVKQITIDNQVATMVSTR